MRTSLTVPSPTRSLAADYSSRADAYARYWAPVIHPMARPLLETMPLTTASTILDGGAGTGGLWPLIHAAAPGARILGIDRSEGMLRAGGALLRGHAAVMDAQQLGARAASFDAALLLFVLQHIPDPVCALGEIRSALRSGGVLGMVVWGQDPGLPGGPIWADELDRAGAAPDPRDPSVMRQAWMDTPEKLTGLIRNGGLVPQRVWTQRFSHAWRVDDLMITQSHCGLPSRRLESLSDDARRDCAARVRARMSRLTPAELEYQVEVIYAVAVTPP